MDISDKSQFMANSKQMVASILAIAAAGRHVKLEAAEHVVVLGVDVAWRQRALAQHLGRCTKTT